MAFNDLKACGPEIEERQKAITLEFERFGLNPPIASSIRAVFQWRQLVLSLDSSCSGSDEAKALLKYYKVMGYIPSKTRSISRAKASAPTEIEETTQSIARDLYSGAVTPIDLARGEVGALQTRYPHLTRPQIQILQSIVSQELQLRSLEVAPLASCMPFPITQFNYLGRFLAGGCDNPQQAARHLQLAAPFLIRMRSLFEGLHNTDTSIWHLEITSPAERGSGDGRVSKKQAPVSAQHDAVKVIHAAINNSADFCTDDRPTDLQPLVCIQMPRLPNINADHIDRRQYPELAVALYDWLFHGTKHSDLFTYSAVSADHEKRLGVLQARLYKLHSDLDKLEAISRRKGISESQRERAHKKESVARLKINALENKIEQLQDSPVHVKTIIEQIEQFPESYRHFRERVREYRDTGGRIVFSFFGERASESLGSTLVGSMVQWLDLAMNAPRALSTNPAVQILKQSAFLVNDSALAYLRGGYQAHSGSIIDSVHDFEIDTDEINISTRLVVAQILPQREDPNISALLGRIIELLPPPGVQTVEGLKSLVQHHTRKRNPSPGDYLEYTFERLSTVSEDQLHGVLEVLHRLGISKVSPRVQELSNVRFKHPSTVLPSFRVYSSNYQPNKMGTAPAIFMDRALFRTYLSLGIDSLGMASESWAIQEHLQRRGIVAVVDGTNYHPELDSTIDATGDKLQKEDSARTSEVWGNYVRPAERVIRSLALRLMEGDVVPELKNASLMGIVAPDRVSQVLQKLIEKFYGLDIDINPDLSAINQVLADLKLHDDNVVLVVDARYITDLEQYRDFIGLLEKYQIKIILRTREPFPGIPQVNIQPFLEQSVVERIMLDARRLQGKLGLSQPIDRLVVEFAARQVQRCRQPQADPLNLTLVVLHGAAAHARLHPDRALTEQDVVAALPPIFHLPDGQQMRLRIDAIDSFLKRAPLQVLGQDRAIETIGSKVKNHILGMRDPTRPLTLLIPGPTGVGKTELMMYIARICDIPFFMVEGAEFSEAHTVSRLVGSPSGYQGPDEGILFTFLKENNTGLVFIDEIEKMDPAVYQALMNFFDKATLTAGNGKTVSRPGFIIVGASNAGADRLRRDMDTREVKEILTEAFVDRTGRPRPELVRRFDPVVMHAIEQTAFKQMLYVSIESIGERPGFVNANLRLIGFDDVAVELLYNRSRQVCEYNEANIVRFGFSPSAHSPAQDGLYYDMRHVSRALDELAGDSLQNVALEQYTTGKHQLRAAPRRVRLVGDRSAERINLVDA